MLDAAGPVAELATANIWYAKDGEAHTPMPNGTFLNGITRQRDHHAAARAGITVHERAIPWQDFLEADEVFSTGNYAKVMPITRDRAPQSAARPHLPEGPRTLLGLMRTVERHELYAPVLRWPRSGLRRTGQRRFEIGWL